MIYNSILETIGGTPIVRLNHIGQDLPCEVYVKVEAMNPGGSIKDRLAVWLIEDMEKQGKLKPGGTIVESTSGNTGFGLAMAAAVKGYKTVFVLSDKMSSEKIRNLRAFGARVVVAPSHVEPEDPNSYYNVARRIAEETPNSVYMDQYNNLANRECHYRTTGPEILKQMPDLDLFVAAMGTGGTLCGTGKYLREQKPGLKAIGVDPVGSILFDLFKTGKQVEAHAYKVEGIGEDFIPENYDFNVIDDMVQVDDKASFQMTRELLLQEGLFVGGSSGSAVAGALKWAQEQGEAIRGKKMLIVLPDSGNRYLSKIFDDAWMEEFHFLDQPGKGTVEYIADAKRGHV